MKEVFTQEQQQRHQD